MGTQVYIMIGPAGTGKTTAAKVLAKKTNAEIFSSDAIREELYGDEAIQGDSKEVFNILFRRARFEAAYQCPVIIDATNLTRKYRKWCMNHFKNFNFPVDFYAVVIDTPIEQAKKRNANRKRNVPEEVIDRQYKQFQYPKLDEGFKKIIHF